MREVQDDSLWTLRTDRIYDSVRTDPRFQALLKKIGLVK